MSKQMILLCFIIGLHVIFYFLASYNYIQIKRTTKSLRKELQGECVFPKRITFYYLTSDEQRSFKIYSRITDFTAIGMFIPFYYSWTEVYIGNVTKSLIALFLFVILFAITLVRHQYITSRIKNKRTLIFTDKKEHPLKIRLERRKVAKVQHYHESLRNYSIVGFICIIAAILMIWHIRGYI